jgi:hypothetical protein
MTTEYVEHPAVNTMGSFERLISRNFKFAKSQLVGQFEVQQLDKEATKYFTFIRTW